MLVLMEDKILVYPKVSNLSKLIDNVEVDELPDDLHELKHKVYRFCIFIYAILKPKKAINEKVTKMKEKAEEVLSRIYKGEEKVITTVFRGSKHN